MPIIEIDISQLKRENDHNHAIERRTVYNYAGETIGRVFDVNRMLDKVRVDVPPEGVGAFIMKFGGKFTEATFDIGTGMSSAPQFVIRVVQQKSIVMINGYGWTAFATSVNGDNYTRTGSDPLRVVEELKQRYPAIAHLQPEFHPLPPEETASPFPVNEIHVERRSWVNSGGNSCATYLACYRGVWDGKVTTGHHPTEAAQELITALNLPSDTPVRDCKRPVRCTPTQGEFMKNIRVIYNNLRASDEAPWEGRWITESPTTLVSNFACGDSPQDVVRQIKEAVIAAGVVPPRFEPTWEVVTDWSGRGHNLHVEQCGSNWRAKVMGYSKWMGQGMTEAGAVLDLQTRYPQYTLGYVEKRDVGNAGSLLPLPPLPPVPSPAAPRRIFIYYETGTGRDSFRYRWRATFSHHANSGFSTGTPEESLHVLVDEEIRAGRRDYDPSELIVVVGSYHYSARKLSGMWEVSRPSSNSLQSASADNIINAINTYRHLMGDTRISEPTSPPTPAPRLISTPPQRPNHLRGLMNTDVVMGIDYAAGEEPKKKPARAKRVIDL